ncbi:hypothetical protein [Frankia sp. CiP1_Cm_nod2]|uniref:hypothetical protein n=1 Tax=Frankia sp. CiP1_Cm_nod2 TaxID=2897161 RepID=UPI00202480CC
MSQQLTRMRAELRQRRHHRAFRIAPPAWDEFLCEQMERLLAEITELGDLGAAEPESQPDPPRPGPGPGPGSGSGPCLDEKALARAVTNLWKAQRKLAEEEEPSARARQAARYLRACRDALAEAGLVVQDHDGDAFHPGRSIEVLAFQEDFSLDTEKVLETVRPSVYFQDRRVQMGQVIVGRPPSSGPVGTVF